MNDLINKLNGVCREIKAGQVEMASASVWEFNDDVIGFHG